MSVQQFKADGYNTMPVPGMRLWPDDDGYQPRDMSWGYVVNADGKVEHVFHGDWVQADDPFGVHAHVARGQHE